MMPPPNPRQKNKRGETGVGEQEAREGGQPAISPSPHTVGAKMLGNLSNLIEKKVNLAKRKFWEGKRLGCINIVDD